MEKRKIDKREEFNFILALFDLSQVFLTSFLPNQFFHPTLFVRHQTNARTQSCSKDRGLIIHISATKLRLLELADEIGFTKRTRNGMRNFNIGSLDDFIFDSMYIFAKSSPHNLSKFVDCLHNSAL
jgi:hypothetical protein